MKANATRSESSTLTLMSPASGKIAEAAITVMQIFGIKKLTCTKLKSADFEKIIADVAMFEEANDDIRGAGLLIKDAIAAILASVGVISIEITKEDGDSEALKKGYDMMVQHLRDKIDSFKKAKEEADKDKKASPACIIAPKEYADQEDTAVSEKDSKPVILKPLIADSSKKCKKTCNKKSNSPQK